MKMKYIYWDNKKKTWIHPVGDELHGHWISEKLFECEVEGILEADIEFKKALEKDPIKLAHIGVTYGK